jgi:hypothetical protein
MQFTTDRMKKIVTIDKVTDNPKSIQLAIENYSICMENRLRKENEGQQRTTAEEWRRRRLTKARTQRQRNGDAEVNERRRQTHLDGRNKNTHSGDKKIWNESVG